MCTYWQHCCCRGTSGMTNLSLPLDRTSFRRHHVLVDSLAQVSRIDCYHTPKRMCSMLLGCNRYFIAFTRSSCYKLLSCWDTLGVSYTTLTSTLRTGFQKTFLASCARAVWGVRSVQSICDSTCFSTFYNQTVHLLYTGWSAQNIVDFAVIAGCLISFSDSAIAVVSNHTTWKYFRVSDGARAWIWS